MNSQSDDDGDDGQGSINGSVIGNAGVGGSQGEEEDALEEDDNDLPDEDGRQDENPIEFVDDSCERNQNSWLRFPPEFINPAKMCSVNKHVQCVDEKFLQYSLHHVPYGPEYVMVGHDSPSLPAHFLKWIWAMSQINCMQQYPNCVVPVVALTEVMHFVFLFHARVSTQSNHILFTGLVLEKGQRSHGNQHQETPGDTANVANGRSTEIRAQFPRHGAARIGYDAEYSRAETERKSLC